MPVLTGEGQHWNYVLPRRDQKNVRHGRHSDVLDRTRGMPLDETPPREGTFRPDMLLNETKGVPRTA